MSPPRILGALLPLFIASSCCVAPARSDDWLAVGWRSPTQAFTTFQTAIRADSAELEYRTFSNGFRERNQISKIAWREAREELRKRYPWLRKGIADAAFVSPPEVVGARAHATIASHGTEIAIEFVREDFAELWEGDTLVADDLVVFDRATFVQKGADGRRWFQGSVALPSGDESGSEITEQRLGREWKIDSFEAIESSSQDARSRAEAKLHQENLD
ncbi:MAG: hypothetical protein SGI72_13960 [Planctomycetota bacterium]|nr:hypothetical protein [Planctomycetota bacterium]